MDGAKVTSINPPLLKGQLTSPPSKNAASCQVHGVHPLHDDTHLVTIQDFFFSGDMERNNSECRDVTNPAEIGGDLSSPLASASSAMSSFDSLDIDPESTEFELRVNDNDARGTTLFSDVTPVIPLRPLEKITDTAAFVGSILDAVNASPPLICGVYVSDLPAARPTAIHKFAVSANSTCAKVHCRFCNLTTSYSRLLMRS